MLGSDTCSVALDGEIVARLGIFELYRHVVRILIQVGSLWTARRIPQRYSPGLIITNEGFLNSAHQAYYRKK